MHFFSPEIFLFCFLDNGNFLAPVQSQLLLIQLVADTLVVHSVLSSLLPVAPSFAFLEAGHGRRRFNSTSPGKKSKGLFAVGTLLLCYCSLDAASAVAVVNGGSWHHGLPTSSLTAGAMATGPLLINLCFCLCAYV